MVTSPNGALHVYVLNAGQADTTIIVMPAGKVILIDAVRPDKLVHLLTAIGLPANGVIEHLVITHPHSDHYSGANRLAGDYQISQATLSPFWSVTY